MAAPLELVSDPVRLRVVRELERCPGATLLELADAAGLHANTVRQHLAALDEAGALSRESGAPDGRGRPPARYRLAGHWTLPTADFRGLAELLAAAVVRGGADADDMRAVGLDWGRYLVGRPGEHDPARDLPEALERLGFSARVEGDDLEITACPCSLVLPGRPELICELAAAVADGVLAGSGTGAHVVERSHDPAARRCAARIGGPGGPRRRDRGATHDA